MPTIPFNFSSNPLPDAPDAVLDRERRPRVDTRNVQQAIGNLADASKLPLINGKAMAAPYEALGAIGEAVAKAGNVLGAAVEQRQRMESRVLVSRSEAQMQAALIRLGEFQEENPDPLKWRAQFDAQIKPLEGELLKAAASHPDAAREIKLRYDNFVTVHSAEVDSKITSALNNEARAGLVSRAGIAIKTGKRKELDALLDGPDGMLLHDFQKDALRFEFDRESERQKKQAEADDARLQLKETEADIINGGARTWLDKNKEPWQGKEQLWLHGRNFALSEVRAGTTTLIAEVDSFIADKVIQTPEDIDSIDDPNMTPALAQSLKRSLLQSEEFDDEISRRENGPALYKENYRLVEDYKASDDPDGVKLLELRQKIRREVGSDDDGWLMRKLWGKATGKNNIGPRDELRQLADDTIKNTFHESKGAIPWIKQEPVYVLDRKGEPVMSDGKPRQAVDENNQPKWNKVVDLKAKQRAAEIKADVSMRVNDWLKLNPKPTPQELGEQVKKLLPEGTRVLALDAMKKAYTQPRPGTAGVVTSYGYAGDATPDSNSAAGIGSFTTEADAKGDRTAATRLRKGDLAVSPDVEKAFSDAGIRPGGEVLIELSNGERRRVRWMDRTAQDSDISSGKVKGVKAPLRGRFDLYSPGGKSAMDGVRVVGWMAPEGGAPSIRNSLFPEVSR